MPKMKTHKGAAKRFKVTAKKRIKRRKAYKNHKALAKSTKQNKDLSKPAFVSSSDEKRIHKLMPYEF